MIRCSAMALSKVLGRRLSCAPASLSSLSQSQLVKDVRLHLFLARRAESGLLHCIELGKHRAPFGTVGNAFHPRSAVIQAGVPVKETRAESAARRDARKHPFDKEDIAAQTSSSATQDITVIPKGSHLFFSHSETSWESLGLDAPVAGALQGAGFSQPSRVQEAAIPKILEGRDVVIAAETGSGKTLTYLTPLIQVLLSTKQAAPAPEPLTPSVIASQLASGQEVRLPLWAQAEGNQASAFVLVLCPNATLCQQVADMAHALRDTEGAPLLKIAVVAGGQQPPAFTPDIVVATPAGLLNMLYAFDRKKRRRTAFARDVRFVVVDEADMLLSGGFAKDVAQLLVIFRQAEKELSKSLETESQEPGTGVSSTERLGRTESSVDMNKGVTRESEQGEERVRSWVDEQGEESGSESSAGETEWEAEAREDRKQAQAGGIWDEDVVASSSVGAQANNGPTRRRERRRKVWVRSKQFIFVAATLPNSGKMSVGALLRKQFPEAAYVKGELLHQHNPLLKLAWQEIGRENRVSALMEAIAGPDWQQGSGKPLEQRTLIFANSTEAAEAVSKLLTSQGLSPLKYHSGVTSSDKAAAIRTFSDRGGVLVCTDAAARGLDVPDVGHVIQAEFATSAVDFLHRIGRTGRAGKAGLVTSFFTQDRRALVEAVREAVEAQEPVERTFSRKRSFRKKLKKFGVARKGVPNQTREDVGSGDEAQVSMRY